MSEVAAVPGVTRFEIDYSRWNGRLLGALGLGPRFSHVLLGKSDVHVRMGWGFETRIPVENIRRIAAAERPFFAWGVHGWRGRWLVNGSSRGIVALEIDPPVRGRTLCFPLRLRTVYVSLVDRDGFLHALGSRVDDAGASDEAATGTVR
jgi:hypothetical protein